MFGNQQNRQVAKAAAASSVAGESFTSNAEKRELLVKKIQCYATFCTRTILGIHLYRHSRYLGAGRFKSSSRRR